MSGIALIDRAVVDVPLELPTPRVIGVLLVARLVAPVGLEEPYVDLGDGLPAGSFGLMGEGGQGLQVGRDPMESIRRPSRHCPLRAASGHGDRDAVPREPLGQAQHRAAVGRLNHLVTIPVPELAPVIGGARAAGAVGQRWPRGLVASLTTTATGMAKAQVTVHHHLEEAGEVRWQSARRAHCVADALGGQISSVRLREVGEFQFGGHPVRKSRSHFQTAGARSPMQRARTALRCRRATMRPFAS